MDEPVQAELCLYVITAGFCDGMSIPEPGVCPWIRTRWGWGGSSASPAVSCWTPSARAPIKEIPKEKNGDLNEPLMEAPTTQLPDCCGAHL
eukprot:1190541-Prorocentrum_minimum.AAC.2